MLQILNRCARATTVFCAILAIRPAAGQSLPSRLSDTEFWKLVSGYSEPTGTFPSENFTSNEFGFQFVIPELLRTTKTGGVYLGVGPEQNFTYIAALRPKIAFIVDIRRQAVLQHLIYKAAFELSKDRVAFLTLLFARQPPPGLDVHSAPNALMAAFDTLPADTALAARNLDRITKWLTGHHGFALSDGDLDGIRHVYEVIARDGVHLSYGSRSGASPGFNMVSIARGPVGLPPVVLVRPGLNGIPDTIRGIIRFLGNGRLDTIPMPRIVGCRADSVRTTIDGIPILSASPPQPCPVQPGSIGPLYLSTVAGTAASPVRSGGINRNDFLMLMNANDGSGVQRSFLANEENYRIVREMHQHNLIVPVVGDVSGPKALRSVAEYLTSHHATVTAYYTSNVEQYLFQNAVWRQFYDNVAQLPVDSTSVFIRSLPASQIGSIRDLLAAVAAGLVTSYQQLLQYSHQ